MSILDTTAASAHAALDPIAALIKNPFSNSTAPNKERPVDFPGGLQIIEFINGAPVADNKILKLTGNMMPFQPFKWGGEQRLAKEYYAGNPEPSVHVLGPKEGPVNIKGRFKDKRLKDAGLYGASYQISLAIDAIRKRGSLVKMSMNGPDGSWARFGFIEKVDWEMNKLSWVNYDIEFFVISERQPINNYFAAPEKQSSSQVNENLINAMQAFSASYSAIPSTVPQSLAEKMNGLINGVAKNINLVTGFVTTVLSTGQDVANSANRALGLIKNARAQISIFNRQFNAIVQSFANLGTVGTDLKNFASGFQSPKIARQVVSAQTTIAYSYESMAGTAALTAYLAQMQAQFEAISKTIPISRHRVQAGDTLQNISIKFYKISDHWTNIYDHNKLQSTQLIPGTVLEIPKL